MKTTVEYLDAVKARLDLPSDYALAKALCVTRAAVSKYRLGLSVFDDNTALRVAEVLSVTPFEVIAAANAERSKDEPVRALWEGAWEKFSRDFWLLVLPANACGALFPQV
jgi:transcriptional regulator with XRE-family HTH domain